jgi:hypothetical protein
MKKAKRFQNLPLVLVVTLVAAAPSVESLRKGRARAASGANLQAPLEALGVGCC